MVEGKNYEIYEDFWVESWYGIRVLDRQKIPEPSAMFEPWMISEENDGAGVTDFRVREKVNCGHSIVERDYFNLSGSNSPQLCCGEFQPRVNLVTFYTDTEFR